SGEHVLLLRSSLPFADVPRNLGCTDHIAGGIPEWRYGEGNVDQTSVLAPPNAFIMLDAFATSNAFKDGRLFVMSLWRHQDGYGLADHLVRSIPVQSLRALVPARDNAVQVLGDYRVARGLYDLSETQQCQFVFAPLFDLD